MMHLGPRVAALVDGQLSAIEEERAWAHVHACAACRAAVEREGWIKRQLTSLSLAGAQPTPAGLKGTLCRPPAGPYAFPPETPRERRGRRLGALVALGAGSAGAAMVGVIALGAAPAQTPVTERRAPIAGLSSSAPQPRPASDREVAAAFDELVSAFRLGR